MDVLCMAGCDMATIKQRHPLRDVFVAPYGCIGTVERSIEQRDFLNSCFTNLMHCNLLSVSTDASVERGVLLVRTAAPPELHQLALTGSGGNRMHGRDLTRRR